MDNYNDNVHSSTGTRPAEVQPDDGDQVKRIRERERQRAEQMYLRHLRQFPDLCVGDVCRLALQTILAEEAPETASTKQVDRRLRAFSKSYKQQWSKALFRVTGLSEPASPFSAPTYSIRRLDDGSHLPHRYFRHQLQKIDLEDQIELPHTRDVGRPSDIIYTIGTGLYPVHGDPAVDQEPYQDPAERAGKSPATLSTDTYTHHTSDNSRSHRQVQHTRRYLEAWRDGLLGTHKRRSVAGHHTDS